MKSRIRRLTVAALAMALMLVAIPTSRQSQTHAQSPYTKRTLSIFTSAARATTTSSVFDIGDADALIGFLDVTAKSGTSPTLDVKFQDSPNNATWFDLGGTTFTQVTATTSSQTVVASRAPARYIRAVATVGGSSTPLYTFTLQAVVYKAPAVAVTTTQGGTASFSGFTFTGANGTAGVITTTCEEVTLATDGLTTDTTANLLPANSIILNVTGIVTTTITTATGWKLGDANVAGRFTANNTTLTAGTRDTGSVHWLSDTTAANAGPYQVTAAKVRITAAAANPGAGKVRVCVTALTFTAPTS